MGHTLEIILWYNFLDKIKIKSNENNNSLHQDDITYLKKELAIRNKCRRYKSRLDPYKNQIITLRNTGISYQGIAYWLLTRKKVKITPEAISLRIKKWNAHETG